MYIQCPVYDVYSVPTSSLLNLHSGLFIHQHVIGNAWLLSSSASVKAIYGVCILLWGYGGSSPQTLNFDKAIHQM